MSVCTVDDTFEATERICVLAQEAARRGTARPLALRPQNQTYAYYELYRDLALYERQARSFAYALTHEPVRISRASASMACGTEAQRSTRSGPIRTGARTAP